MGVDEAVEIRRLSPEEVSARLDDLAAVLHDCVAGGASIGYVDPFGPDDARVAFAGFAAEVAAGRRLLVAALLDGRVVGTVQVALAFPPNQPHRGEITKLLVHRDARRKGIAERLMAAAEGEARREGKTLLVLGAVSDGDAARLYARMGWAPVGIVPDFALYPDGRFCDTTYFFKRL